MPNGIQYSDSDEKGKPDNWRSIGELARRIVEKGQRK